MPTRRLTQSIQIGDVTLVGSESRTAGTAVSIDEAVAGQTSIVLSQAIDVSALHAIFVLAESVELNITFNGPDFEVDVPAGQAFVWTTTSGHANPFGSIDVTSIDVNNSETPAGRVKIELLIDPTP